MRIPYRYRPGAGFILLLTVSTCATVFLAWGFGQPRLERVWLLLEEVDQGKVLAVRDAAFLDEALRQYPAIVADILDEDRTDLLEPEVEGFSTARTFHLVLAPVGAHGGRFFVECRGALSHPVKVSLRARNLSAELVFDDDGAQTWVVTADMTTAGPDSPFLVTVTVDGEFEAQGQGLVGIRIGAQEKR